MFTRVSFLGLSMLIALTSSAAACQCPPKIKASHLLSSKENLSKQPKNAVVFVAEILSREQHGDARRTWTLKVLLPIKGDAGDLKSLENRRPIELCGFDIKVSSIAVFVAQRHENEWTQNECYFPEQDVSSDKLLKFAQERQR